MRPRLAVLAIVVTTLAAVAVPSVATAAPRHNRGLTINAIPNPIDAGEGVFIYGHLNVGPVAGQTIVLYHHLAGSGLGYTKVGQTTTDSHGFYEFTRAEDVVMTNRSWFVREAGVHQIHSRTVFERVAALVSLSASTPTAVTGQPVVFTGQSTPNHAGERVVLQEETAVRQLAEPQGRPSRRRIELLDHLPLAVRRRPHRPGAVPAATSATSAAPRTRSRKWSSRSRFPGFTINSSDQLISYGQSVTISGVLDEPSSATTPEPNTPVTLWARSAFRASSPRSPTRPPARTAVTRFAPQTPTVQHRVPGSDHAGSAPSQRGAVRGRPGRGHHDTELDHLARSAGRVTFTGTVLPDKAGHVIYLQRLGADGDWHNEEVRFVTNADHLPVRLDVRQGRARTSSAPGSPATAATSAAPRHR